MEKNGFIKLSNGDNMRAIDLASIQMVISREAGKNKWTISIKMNDSSSFMPLSEYDTKESCEQDFNAICKKRWGNE